MRALLLPLLLPPPTVAAVSTSRLVQWASRRASTTVSRLTQKLLKAKAQPEREGSRGAPADPAADPAAAPPVTVVLPGHGAALRCAAVAVMAARCTPTSTAAVDSTPNGRGGGRRRHLRQTRGGD